jgi:hypothetical protein
MGYENMEEKIAKGETPLNPLAVISVPYGH